jgi:alcohol dehydrogenase (cytochrome c)
MYQAAVAGVWQTTPLVVDGVMYLTQRLERRRGARRQNRPRLLDLPPHAGSDADRLLRREQPRLAILGDTLYMGTLDAHLVAIDAKSGPPCGTRSGRSKAATRSPMRRWS